ncbi:hypothetical protein O6H91_Y069500 [Diphasiastrum complanatum]|nr:hypothetical protein O6H91_Y069500 [Diphasiastrum complanatum]KAJ7297261.1 hypothetical protein O6H91_Y069500 [Diphasiastrum complanatum]
MASWPFAGIDNFPISWSSTSQFDDMVWDEFGETDDHIVPNPQGLEKKSIWVSNSDRRKRLQLEGTPVSLKFSGQVFQEVVKKPSSSKPPNEENVMNLVVSKSEQPFYYMSAPCLREKRDSLFDGNPAAGFETLFEEKPSSVQGSKGEIGTSAGLSPNRLLVKEESSNLDLSELYMNDSLYQEDDSSIMSHSSPFPLFEIGVDENELELFGVVNTADKKGLDLSWGNINNLDDMDKLFEDGDVSLGQETNDCLVPFPWSSSSQSLDGSSTIRNSESSGKCSSIIESTKLEEITQEKEVKRDCMFQDCAPLEEEKDRQTSLAVKDLQMSLKDDRGPHLSTDQANELPQVVNVRQLSPQHHHPAGPLDSTSDLHVQETTDNGSRDCSHILKKKCMEKGMDILSQSCSSADKGSQAKQRASSRREKFKREISHKRGLCLTRNYSQAPPISMGEQCLQMKSPQQLWGLAPSVPHSFKGLSPAFQQPPFMLADPFVYQQRSNPLPGLPMGHHPSIFPLLVPKPCSTPPHPQHFRPLLAGYQHPFIEKQKFNQISKEVVDAPIYPPFNENKMNLHEKVENSEYQETLPARSGGEHHLQKLVSQQVAVDPKQKQQKVQQSQGPSTAPGITRLMYSSDAEFGHSSSGIPMSAAACEETMKESENLLEDKVLHQLQTIIQKLDARTKLCFRDALYRLSKSAMCRQRGGDSRSSTGSMEKPSLEPNIVNFASKADPTSLSSISRLAGTNILDVVGVSSVEAETNRIDRTIANMLFHKPSSSSAQPFAPLSGVDAAFDGSLHVPFVPESPLALHPSVLQQGIQSSFVAKAKPTTAQTVQLLAANTANQEVLRTGPAIQATNCGSCATHAPMANPNVHNNPRLPSCSNLALSSTLELESSLRNNSGFQISSSEHLKSKLGTSANTYVPSSEAISPCSAGSINRMSKIKESVIICTGNVIKDAGQVVVNTQQPQSV